MVLCNVCDMCLLCDFRYLWNKWTNHWVCDQVCECMFCVQKIYDIEGHTLLVAIIHVIMHLLFSATTLNKYWYRLVVINYMYMLWYKELCALCKRNEYGIKWFELGNFNLDWITDVFLKQSYILLIIDTQWTLSWYFLK